MDTKDKKRTINSFEDLEIWKMGMQISIKIYEIMKNYKYYGLKDQMQRAVVSVLSNIAEGFERQTNKEFIQFLYIAKGSCGELRTQLYLAKELGYIVKEDYTNLLNNTKSLSAMLYRFIETKKKGQI